MKEVNVGEYEPEDIRLECDGSSGNVELEEAIAKHLLTVFKTFKKKQASYGSANIATFGLKGVIIRMNDKMQRLIKIGFHDEPNPLNDETMEDTLVDMADYAVIGLVVKAGDWH